MEPAANFLLALPQSRAMYYRPIKIRIPASSARIPITLFGITKRTINGSPCKINQTASNVIPTDMLFLLVLLDETKYRGPFQWFDSAHHERNLICYASFQPFQSFKCFNDDLSAFSHFNLEP
jgi:hypothetical protein